MEKPNRHNQLLLGVCALSLSLSLNACGPSPTSQPGPSAPPSAQPSPDSSAMPSVQPSAIPAASALTVHLQADASLAGFATAQQGPLTLCLGQIASVETRINGSEPLRQNLSLKDLLKGVDIPLSAVPTGRIEGRTSFFNAAGQELGFVSWQAEVRAGGNQVTVLLRATSDTHSG
ncbi:MAG TPA: hypothetical protein V6D23_27025, partial [Candidatus Obscuribacterales bacterium]